MSDTISKQKILIVDDEPMNIRVLSEILRGEYEIYFAANGKEALDTAESEPLDLILLDIMMPEMDGYEVCRKLKRNSLTQEIPVIFITAKDDALEEAKGFGLGAVDYIKKPVNSAVVNVRVKTHLLLRRTQETLKNQNIILREKVRERTEELEKTQIEIVDRLGLASEYRDEETGNHVKRISEYCRYLGNSAGLSPDGCDMLALSSTLHDLGKIGIPDGILLKPSSLTEDEWTIMRKHTTIGAKLLSGSNSKLLHMAESIALTHHEKWDGTGYPMGIKGDAIPLVGRITGLCDVFDALMSERPYKRAWPLDKTLDEINKEAGHHFDPELVKHFNDLIKKMKIVVDELK